MNYLCDVIVLAWNKLDTTKAFVESFLANTSVPSRLIMIDNASTDGTKDYLLSLKDMSLHTFKVIINDENRGFVGGMNQGIEISDAPYICLSNNDLIFTKGWLSEIISVFKGNNNIGLLNPNSNNLGAKPSKGISIEDFAVELKNKHDGVFIEMPFCIGFCMMIKREVIDKVGGLSKEFYPMFFEDTDYSLKVSKAGYLIGMAQSSYVWHKEHVSLKSLSEKKKEEYFAKSRNVFLEKWGKILRIAWVVGDHQDLLKNLGGGIALARGGNFVWFFAQNLDVNKTAIFKENNSNENTGINFIKFANTIHLLWKILKKKKKYDLIITDNKFLKWIFNKTGYRILVTPDKDIIEGIKKSGHKR